MECNTHFRRYFAGLYKKHHKKDRRLVELLGMRFQMEENKILGTEISQEIEEGKKFNLGKIFDFSR